MTRFKIPPCPVAARIGLLGGSFDPPHEGHVRITYLARARLGLDRVWWVVSPQNPLKETPRAALRARLAACRALCPSLHVDVCAPEAALGFNRTADLLDALRACRPDLRFIWLMGADNFTNLHHWARWRDIVVRTPIAVFDRPGHGLKARLSPAARRYRKYRRSAASAPRLGAGNTPDWLIVSGFPSRLSSSRLRAEAGIQAFQAPSDPE